MSNATDGASRIRVDRGTHRLRRSDERTGPGLFLLTGGTFAVLVATLMPGVDQSPVTEEVCRSCDGRQVADGIVNALLFVPLGAGLGICFRSIRLPALVGFFLSCSVEVAQNYWVPGRDPNPGDVLFNTIGVVLAAWAADSNLCARWRTVPMFWLLWGAFAGVVLLGSAFLLQASLPSPSVVLWTAGGQRLEPYLGNISHASLGSASLRPGYWKDTDSIWAQWARGEVLELRGEAGPKTAGLAQLLYLEDRWRRSPLFVGIDRNDLFLQIRTRAADLHLDQPAHRAVGAFRDVREGHDLLIRLWRHGPGYCSEVNGRVDCSLVHSVSRGWSLLYFREDFYPPVPRMLDALWIVVLFWPLGLVMAQKRLEALLAITCALLGLLLPSVLGWTASTSMVDVVAVCLGLFSGAWVTKCHIVRRAP